MGLLHHRQSRHGKPSHYELAIHRLTRPPFLSFFLLSLGPSIIKKDVSVSNLGCVFYSRPILAWDLSDLLQNNPIRVVESILY